MKQRNLIVGLILILFSFVFILIYVAKYIPENEAEDIFNEAKIIFEREDVNSIERSIDLFTKIIAKDKYNKTKYAPASYFFIGKAYEKIGLNRQAYTKYSYILKNQSNHIDNETKSIIVTRMAHLKLMRNQTDEAIHDLMLLLSKSKNGEPKSRVYCELGYSYLYIKNFKKALESFNHALLENGKNEEALLGKARTLKRMGRDREVYEIYRDFLSYFGHESQYTGDVQKAYNIQAYYSGLNSARKGRYSEAIKYFDIVINKFPSHKLSENAYYWMGESYYGMRNYSKAISVFQKGLNNNLHHKDQDCRIKIGYCYFMMKQYDKAAKQFQIYIEQYEKGKYIERARQWKEASVKELTVQYRLENEENQVVDNGDLGLSSSSDMEDDKMYNSEVKGEYYIVPGKDQKVYLENVTEI